MTKRLAIIGGGDWYDASFDLLNLPDDVDLRTVEDEYKQWKKENWSPGNYIGHEGKYINFPEWLRVFKGATDSDVIEYWEEYP